MLVVFISRRDLMALKDAFDNIHTLLTQATVDHATLDALKGQIDAIPQEIADEVAKAIAGMSSQGLSALKDRLDALEAGVEELGGGEQSQPA